MMLRFFFVCFVTDLMTSYSWPLAPNSLATSTSFTKETPCPGRPLVRVNVTLSDLKCLVKPDDVNNGSFVSCSGKNLTFIDQGMFPDNTTTLILDSNNISILCNETFTNLTDLRYLSLKSSNVTKIQASALKGLSQLRVLNLEGNHLPIQSSFPLTMFIHVPKLQHLFIGSNSRENLTYIYSDDFKIRKPKYTKLIDIFDDLPGLEKLSIDSLTELYVGAEFSKLRNLSHLTLNCIDVFKSSNDSFEGLSNSTVKHLVLTTFSEVYEPYLPSHIFNNLPKLEALHINDWEIGNQNLIKSLWPFQNGSLTSLKLNFVGYSRYRESPLITFQDGILTENITRHIASICLNTLILTNNRIFAIEPEAMKSPTWFRCLKKIDLSGNYLDVTGWRVLIFEMYRMTSVEDITIGGAASTYVRHLQRIKSRTTGVGAVSTYGHHFQPFRKPIRANALAKITYGPTSVVDADKGFDLSNNETRHLVPQTFNSFGEPSTVTSGDEPEVVTSAPKSKHQVSRSTITSEITLYFPKSLRTFRFDSVLGKEYLVLYTNVRLMGLGNLTELFAVNSPHFLWTKARILGLENLRFLDVSGSMMYVSEFFYDDFPSLEVLIMSSIFPKKYIVSVDRILRNLTKLTYLDVSDNGIDTLPPETFSANSKLEYLNLAKNRFQNIPFSFRNTPGLRHLNLSENAILFLEDDEMVAMENQVGLVGEFTLVLKGNAVVCMCSNIKFLVWLQLTRVTLKNDGSLSCRSEDGQVTNTDAFKDLYGLWRQCVGWSSMMVSLILAALLILAFLVVYLIGRFKKSIQAYILRLVAPHFRYMTSDDYKTGVFIGYADDDYRFAINVVARFLEDELGVTTFLHQRDLGTGYADQLFYDAIQDSWRVVLLITDTFLYHYEMVDIVMKYASHCISPVNQGRLFVLVEESQVSNIPSYLYDVLDDNRIILLHGLQQTLTYKQQQRIKRCLEPLNV